MMRLAGQEPSVISIDKAPRATIACGDAAYHGERSSLGPVAAAEVAPVAGRTFVKLDSDHQTEHVYRELEILFVFLLTNMGGERRV
jgi:cephalosporin hydroxylase